MSISTHRVLCVALVTMLLGGCASRRLLQLENRVLHRENADLTARVLELQADSHDPDMFDPEPSLDTVHAFLEKRGFDHPWAADASHIRFPWVGREASFDITIQYFEAADVVFIATSGYLRLSDAQDTSSVVLLMVQLAALNYELLLVMFQLNPETGEVLLSTEVHVFDGLGYDTFLSILEHLIDTADDKYDELERAASGIGL
jgi:hypothetical protein